MNEGVIASRVVDTDYRISRTAHGLWIEVLDYKAEPLFLSRELLDELGFGREEAPHSSPSERGIADTLELLEQAIDALDAQRDSTAKAAAALWNVRRKFCGMAGRDPNQHTLPELGRDSS